MDPLTQIRLTRELIDIDSTTGREAEAGEFIARTLEGLGYSVTRQPVADGRFNVIATVDAPSIVFSTHFDCVPPFFRSREENGRVHGRGACDAKGILVSQIAAVERLRAAGERRVGLLFVVGEERGSDGAKVANTIKNASRYLVNGEPTDNRVAAATRGVYRVRLKATGRAAHSSLPELGESAIDKLIDALVSVRSIEWPSDPVLGHTFYSVGLISGGIAPNVISPEATAELMFRTVGDHADLRRLIETRVSYLVSVEDVLVVPPVRLTSVSGLPTAVFAFTTDIPFLSNWGKPVLAGPGSVTLAHTSDEYCEVSELLRAVDVYAEIAQQLLSSATPSVPSA